MATVQGLTKSRILEIEDALIVSAAFNTDAHLILTKHDGTTIDGGSFQTEGATNIRQTVKNQTGSTLTKGTAVYISGATGDNALVSKASSSSEATSSKTIGLLAEDILNGSFGEVITEGILEGIDTSSATAGDAVWLSSTAGTYVFGLDNKPVAPLHMVYIGVVIRSQSQNGSIYVKPQNGFELNELHDVLITSKTNGDLLKYDSSTGLWKNAAQSTITIAPSQVTGTAVITTDSRLSDTRIPTDATVTDTKIATTLSQSKITNLTTDLAAKAPLTNAVLTTPYTVTTVTSKTAAATLTAAELLGGIITTAPTATFNLTLPSATSLDTGLLSGLVVGGTIDWYVTNTTAFAITMVAGTSHTYVGLTTIATVSSIGSYAQFKTRKNATNSYTTYRVG